MKSVVMSALVSCFMVASSYAQPPIPPTASRPSHNTGNGFFVVGRGIYDANGNLFTPIGANRSHYDWSEPTRFQAKPNVERLMPFFNQDWATVNKPLMDEDVSNKVVPIPTVFYTDYVNGTQTTGATDLRTLSSAVHFWVSQSKHWTTYNNIAMFNIANEWGPCPDDPDVANYKNGYVSAVRTMRIAGYTGPLVVDAGCSGQGADMLVASAAAIEAADPMHNTVFSIHVYGSFYNNTPLCDGCGLQFGPWMQQLAQLNVPVIIGEFGCAGCDGTVQPDPVQADTIMQTGEQYQFGWLAWSWDDTNDGCPPDTSLELLGPCPGDGYEAFYANMSAYGKDVILSPNFGMQAVSKPATVFP